MAAVSEAVEGTSAVVLAEPSTTAEVEVDVAPVISIDPHAHLAYLARLAPTQGCDPLDRYTSGAGPLAEVVDIDAFRARRRS